METDGSKAVAAAESGCGWKVSPAIDINGGEERVLADIDGSGAIQQIWMTPTGHWRWSILRIYWDNETTPSIQCPVGDFLFVFQQAFDGLAVPELKTDVGELLHAFSVSPAWARRIKQIRRDENRTTPLPMGGLRVVKVDLKSFGRWSTSNPMRRSPNCTRLGADTCSESAVTMTLQRLGLTFKESRSMPASRTGPTSHGDAISGRSSGRHATRRS